MEASYCIVDSYFASSAEALLPPLKLWQPRSVGGLLNDSLTRPPKPPAGGVSGPLNKFTNSFAEATAGGVGVRVIRKTKVPTIAELFVFSAAAKRRLTSSANGERSLRKQNN
jgi:hypothetical protein